MDGVDINSTLKQGYNNFNNSLGIGREFFLSPTAGVNLGNLGEVSFLNMNIVLHDEMWNGHGDCRYFNPLPNILTPPHCSQTQQSLLKLDRKFGVDPNSVVPMRSPRSPMLTPPMSSDDDDSLSAGMANSPVDFFNDSEPDSEDCEVLMKTFLDQIDDIDVGAAIDADPAATFDLSMDELFGPCDDDCDYEDIKPDVGETKLQEVKPDPEALKRQEEEGRQVLKYAEIDHCYYHKPRPSPKRSNDLGICTPDDSSVDGMEESEEEDSSEESSDGEDYAEAVNKLIDSADPNKLIDDAVDPNELIVAADPNELFRFRFGDSEIDVVNYDLPKRGRMMPASPTLQERRVLQRSVQSRFPRGVKTLMPVRRAAQKVIAPPEEKKKPAPRNNRRGCKAKKARRDSDSDVEPCDKRNLHNNMERQRRIGLKNLFEELKQCVPDIAKKPRAAKVTILKGAKAYVTLLQKKEMERARERDLLKERIARNQKYLKQLQRQQRTTTAVSRKYAYRF